MSATKNIAQYFLAIFCFLYIQQSALALNFKEPVLTENKHFWVNHFIEFSYHDDELIPESHSSWQGNTPWGYFLKEVSPEGGSRESPDSSSVIELHYSGSGWHVALCSQAEVTKISGGGLSQQPGDKFSRIFPGNSSGYLSILLQPASLPQDCIRLQFDQPSPVILDVPFTDTGLLWRSFQREYVQPDWVKVRIPSALYTPQNEYRLVNDTSSLSGMMLSPNTGSTNFGADFPDSSGDEKPFYPHFYGHPKEALFDIDLAFVYEERNANDDAGEGSQAFAELSFFSSDGTEISTILPGELVAAMTSKLGAEAPGFWKKVINHCPYRECDTLTRTLALLVATSTLDSHELEAQLSPENENDCKICGSDTFIVKGDEIPETEPADMDGSGSRKRSRCTRHSAKGGSGSSGQSASRGDNSGAYANREKAGPHRPGQGSAHTPLGSELNFLPVTQFMLLELAAVIDDDWERVAAKAFSLDYIFIHDLKGANHSTHCAAFRMLLEVKQQRRWQADNVAFYYEALRNRGLNFYADWLLLISRQPEPRGVGISMLYTTLFPNEEAVRNFAGGVQNVQLFAYYLGLAYSEVEDLKGEGDAVFKVLQYFRRKMGFISNPEFLPRLLTALHRAGSSDVLLSPEYIRISPNLVRIATDYLQKLSTADTSLQLSRQSRIVPRRLPGQEVEAISLKPSEISNELWETLKKQKIPENSVDIIELDTYDYQQWLIQLSVQDHDLFIQVAQNWSLIEQASVTTKEGETQCYSQQELELQQQSPKTPDIEVPAQAEGYSNPILDQVTCGICLEIYKDPVVTNCGHSFCRKCLEEQQTHTSNSPCSICRALITTTSANYVLVTLIDALGKSGALKPEPAKASSTGQATPLLESSATSGSLVGEAKAKLQGKFTDEDLDNLTLEGFPYWHRNFTPLGLARWRIVVIKEKDKDPRDHRYAALSFVNERYGENARAALYQHCVNKSLTYEESLLATRCQLTMPERQALKRYFLENTEKINPIGKAMSPVAFTPGLSGSLTGDDLWGLANNGFGCDWEAYASRFGIPDEKKSQIQLESPWNPLGQAYAVLVFLKNKYGERAREELYKICVKNRLMENEEILANFFQLPASVKNRYYMEFQE